MRYASLALRTLSRLDLTSSRGYKLHVSSAVIVTQEVPVLPFCHGDLWKNYYLLNYPRDSKNFDICFILFGFLCRILIISSYTNQKQ